MFKRPHHRKIHRLLDYFNAPLLEETQCYFAGGTAIVLLLNEYRESVDVDFLCGSKEGYRTLRNCVTQQSFGDILRTPVKHLREVRADRDGIRTFLEVDAVPVKVEIVFEARISITGAMHSILPVPVLDIDDLFAEKLLANCDRGADSATASRDAIDLAMLIAHKGDIPAGVWDKVTDAYGKSVIAAFENSIRRLTEGDYLSTSLKKLNMHDESGKTVLEALKRQKPLFADGRS